MKAVVLTGYGEVENLVLREVEEPEPGPGQIKVKAAGASINPVDWKLRRGELRALMPVELPTILGRDVSGEVVALGQGVTQFQVGDRVMGLVEHGYAEVAVGQAAAFAKLPPELELESAGALPLVGLTGAQLVEEAVDANNVFRCTKRGRAKSWRKAAASAKCCSCPRAPPVTPSNRGRVELRADRLNYSRALTLRSRPLGQGQARVGFRSSPVSR